MTENNIGFCCYAKCGNLVTVWCDYLGVSAQVSKILGTLPVNYRPAKSAIGMGYIRGVTSCGQISVDSNGVVGIYCTISTDSYFGACVTYAV